VVGLDLEADDGASRLVVQMHGPLAERPPDVPLAVWLIATQDEVLLQADPVVVIKARPGKVRERLHEQPEVLVVDPVSDHAGREYAPFAAFGRSSGAAQYRNGSLLDGTVGRRAMCG
jgi:hypothetical protein